MADGEQYTWKTAYGPWFDSGKIQRARGGQGELTTVKSSDMERMEAAHGSGWRTASMATPRATAARRLLLRTGQGGGVVRAQLLWGGRNLGCKAREEAWCRWSQKRRSGVWVEDAQR